MNAYTEINSPTPIMTPPTTARRFSLPHLLVTALVSALATFAVTYHVYGPSVAYPTRLVAPIAPIAPMPMNAYATSSMLTYAKSPMSAMYPPNTVSHGFVPTNVCAYGRGACADSVEAQPGTPYPAIRQCTGGKTASMCKCFGVRGKGGAASPVAVLDETLLSSGQCRCLFVSEEGPETSHWGMILGCK